MAPTDRNASLGSEEEDANEDLIASASSLWLPRTVVKRHRKKASLIWIALLVAFFVYVGYIVWDTVDARKDPAASIQLKQIPFTFPDVAVCATFLGGCLKEGVNCLEGWNFTLLGQSGFMEEPDQFLPGKDPDVVKVTNAFPHCAVMPLSRLTVNETGVNNGDITSFRASFHILWYDDPYGDFNATEHTIYSQYVSAHFIDIEQDVDQIGEKIIDVKLPYDRIRSPTGGTFTTTGNHLVISMQEFSGITKTGSRKERERTYSQTTTSGKDTWYWPHESIEYAISHLSIEMLINKFEYTLVQEVDPVDMWAIIGAIGGVWQFVVVAFGVFFIFSEKQRPDKKMRDFHETVIMPAVKINKRLSGITASSRSSLQDIEIDAEDEDLPPGWVKKQRKNGSMYYFHTMTAATTLSPPRERGEPRPRTAATAAPPRPNGIRSLFRVAYEPPDSEAGGLRDSTTGSGDGGSLPPGWLQRADENGRAYYVDTTNQRTQWNRPAWLVHSRSGRKVQPVDTPMRRMRQESSTNVPQPSARPTVIPSSPTATAGVVDNPLPPNWETRITPDGRTYYSNSVTKTTQWKRPG